jgi:hypothetical protein
MVFPLAQTVLIVLYEGCSIAVQGAIAKGSSDAFPGLSTGMLDDRPLGVLHMSCTGTPVVDVSVELRLHRSVCLARQRSLVCHEFGFMALLRVSHLIDRDDGIFFSN